MLEKFKTHAVKNLHSIKGGSYGLLDDSGYVPRNKYRKHRSSEGTQGQIIKSDFS